MKFIYRSSHFCFLFCVCVSTAEAQGLPCEFNGRVYQHGEAFQPNCHHQCTCIDRVVGCMPICPQQVSLPDWRCLRPRLARTEGGCCEEWVCDDDNHISEEPDELTHTSLPDSQPLPNHISALLQVQPQPRHPAATGGATFRGKHHILPPPRLNMVSKKSFILMSRRWTKLSVKTNPNRSKNSSRKHLELISERYLAFGLTKGGLKNLLTFYFSLEK